MATTGSAGAGATPLMAWERKAPSTGPEEAPFTAEAEALAENLFEATPPTDEVDGTSEDTDEPEVDESEEDETADTSKPEDGEDDESEEDGDESDEDEGEQDDLVEVKVSGKTLKVKLDELKKGYSRTADYTKKTQALATERKAFEQEQAATREAREQYQQNLGLLQQALANIGEDEPDWNELRRTNPTQYAVRWADKQQRDQQLAVIRSEQARLEQEQQEERARHMDVVIAAERERLLEAIPEWKDETKAAQGKKALKDYALNEYGFSEEELGNVTDHRVMVMLRKAMLFDRQLAKGTKLIRDKTKPTKKGAVMKPGSPTQRKSSDKRTLERDRDKLARTGREEDAAAVFRHFID